MRRRTTGDRKRGWRREEERKRERKAFLGGGGRGEERGIIKGGWWWAALEYKLDLAEPEPRLGARTPDLTWDPAGCRSGKAIRAARRTGGTLRANCVYGSSLPISALCFLVLCEQCSLRPIIWVHHALCRIACKDCVFCLSDGGMNLDARKEAPAPAPAAQVHSPRLHK